MYVSEQLSRTMNLLLVVYIFARQQSSCSLLRKWLGSFREICQYMWSEEEREIPVSHKVYGVAVCKSVPRVKNRTAKMTCFLGYIQTDQLSFEENTCTCRYKEASLICDPLMKNFLPFKKYKILIERAGF